LQKKIKETQHPDQKILFGDQQNYLKTISVIENAENFEERKTGLTEKMD